MDYSHAIRASENKIAKKACPEIQSTFKLHLTMRCDGILPGPHYFIRLASFNRSTQLSSLVPSHYVVELIILISRKCLKSNLRITLLSHKV